MSDRVSDTLQEPYLFDGAAGDLLAARNAAETILRGVSPAFRETAGTTLFLTAVLLQCALTDGEGATRFALIAQLQESFRTGLAGDWLARSPVQFCRYAAAEFDALTPLQRRELAETLLTAVAKLAAPRE